MSFPIVMTNLLLSREGRSCSLSIVWEPNEWEFRSLFITTPEKDLVSCHSRQIAFIPTNHSYLVPKTMFSRFKDFFLMLENFSFFGPNTDAGF